MNDLQDKYVRIILKNEKEIKQLKGGERINVHLLAETDVPDPEYDWICDQTVKTILPKVLDNYKTDGKGKKISQESVMLSLPSYYCGTEVEVKVRVRSREKKVFPIHEGLFIAPNLQSLLSPGQTVSDSIKFKPICKAEIRDIEWRDGNGNIFGKDRPLEFPSYVVAEVEVWGKNGGVLEGRLDFMGKTIPLRAKIDRNLAFFSFFTGDPRLSMAMKGRESLDLFFQVSYDYFTTSKVFRIQMTRPRHRPLKRIESFPLQPVVVGKIDVAENNYNPCKYTQIDVEHTTDLTGKEKKKVTVFKEGNPVKPVVNIIGGKRKVTVTLLDYTPGKCRLKSGSHKEKTAILSLPGGKEESLPVKVSNKTGTIADLDVRYDYKDVRLLKLLFLPFDRCQYRYIRLKTCRHRHDVALCMVPDIKWEAFLELGSSAPHLYTHTGMPAAYDIFKRHQEKALDASRKIKDIELSFGLSTEYDDGKKVEYTKGMEESVKKVFQVLKIIRDALDVLSFKKNVDDNKEKLKARNIVPKNSKVPFFIEISSPVLHIGGGWQYGTDSVNRLTRKGEIGIFADPLIAAKGGIDLIACSTYIPAAGQIIKAILKVNDLAEWLTDFVSGGKAKYEGLIWFNLYLKGRLSMKGIYEFSSEEKTVKLESPATITFVVELGLSAEVKVETVTICGSVTRAVKAGLSGEASTGLTFKPGMGYSSKEGFYLDFEIRFDGITVKVSGEAKYEKTKTGKKGEKKSSSAGIDMNKEFVLIDPVTIWQGRTHPFASDKKTTS